MQSGIFVEDFNRLFCNVAPVAPLVGPVGSSPIAGRGIHKKKEKREAILSCNASLCQFAKNTKTPTIIFGSIHRTMS